MRMRVSLALTLLLTPVFGAMAQSASPRSVISIQPLSAVFKTFAGEFESAASKSVTWGLGATYWAGFSDSEVKITSGDFKLRYYPNGQALHGFSVGASGGFVSVAGKDSNNRPVTIGGGSVGVLLEYQWLMGEKKNFALALGLGAKALSVSTNDVGGNGFTARYPTARISVGYAF